MVNIVQFYFINMILNNSNRNKFDNSKQDELMTIYKVFIFVLDDSKL